MLRQSLFPCIGLRDQGRDEVREMAKDETNATNRDTSSDTDKTRKSGCGSVEPLPESSRPRRDGPGGD